MLKTVFSHIFCHTSILLFEKLNKYYQRQFQYFLINHGKMKANKIREVCKLCDTSNGCVTYTFLFLPFNQLAMVSLVFFLSGATHDNVLLIPTWGMSLTAWQQSSGAQTIHPKGTTEQALTEPVCFFILFTAESFVGNQKLTEIENWNIFLFSFSSISFAFWYLVIFMSS